MDPILAAGRWETTIGGVHFVSRRKSTAVMVSAQGFAAVAGQMSPGTGESKPEQYLAMLEMTMRAAVIEPVIAPKGEPTIEGQQYAFTDLLPFAGKWFAEFAETGLDAGPTQPSCMD